MQTSEKLPELKSLDVLMLNAGPELDALVSREVYGQPLRLAKGVWYAVAAGLTPGGGAPMVPEWSADWTMLPQLLQKMRERWRFDVMVQREWAQVIGGRSPKANYCSHARKAEQIETHLPVWVCRAALWLAQQEARNAER